MMKKLLSLIFLFSLISLTGFGQGNIISGTFNIQDCGFGVRYDRQIGMFGVYTDIGTGTYHHFNGDLEIVEMKHLKASSGAVIYLPTKGLTNVFFSLGVNYNHYDIIKNNWQGMPKIATTPISFEIGTGYIVNKHFKMGWDYDPLKKDIIFSVGYAFNWKRTHYKIL
jgi:hypothetical protein